MMDDFVIKDKRDIPSIEILASDKDIVSAGAELPRPIVVETIRLSVEGLKTQLGKEINEITFNKWKDAIIYSIFQSARRKLRRVINGTGILVHTNLGRAPLSEKLFDSIKERITGYGNLEFEVDAGRRGHRGEMAERYLTVLAGAEAAVIVNNNAAALFLLLNTLANKKRVIISRGELVQIGGGFRIPDIIRSAGARLTEVGTTNITTLNDYESAIDEKATVILKVHRSNFAVTGFAEEVTVKKLTALGKKYNIPVVNDLGSGVFIDTADFAGHSEPTVQSSVHDEADLTCFSGDKLLGGVQCGLITGKAELVSRLKKNPVYRALRVDKIVFSALEELLGYYLDGTWMDNIKLWRLAAVKESDMYERGRRLLGQINAPDKIVLEGSQGEMGGGALPTVPLPSVALIFRSRLSPQKLSDLFRRANPPVIGRVTKENFMIDLKAIDESDSEILVGIIKQLIPQL